jgi:dTDP-4-amino-4,6-dideoxygalactose transaminase
MHYAGVACEMDIISSIAKKYHLIVIEDAALSLGSAYKKQALGSIGDFGCYSFHYTKSIHCLQGGAIMINRSSDFERAETVREKGTNRIQFLKGEVEKYTWIDKGSNYILSELSAAFLYAQLEQSENVIKKRKTIWSDYYSQLEQLQKTEHLELPVIPDYCTHNASVFYIKVKNQIVRNKLIDHLKKKKIQTAFHYVPLHSSFAGLKFGKFHGEDKYTTKESSRLLRLPLFFDLSNDQVSYICESISAFYK